MKPLIISSQLNHPLHISKLIPHKEIMKVYKPLYEALQEAHMVDNPLYESLQEVHMIDNPLHESSPSMKVPLYQALQ